MPPRKTDQSVIDDKICNKNLKCHQGQSLPTVVVAGDPVCHLADEAEERLFWDQQIGRLLETADLFQGQSACE